jgi:hypothetical protein
MLGTSYPAIAERDGKVQASRQTKKGIIPFVGIQAYRRKGQPDI